MKRIAYAASAFLSVLAAPSQAVTYELVYDEWTMIAIPDILDGQAPSQIFGPGILAADPSAVYSDDWVIFSYSVEEGDYSKVEANAPLNKGQGYWMIQATQAEAVTINIPEVELLRSAMEASICEANEQLTKLQDGSVLCLVPCGDDTMNFSITKFYSDEVTSTAYEDDRYQYCEVQQSFNDPSRIDDFRILTITADEFWTLDDLGITGYTFESAAEARSCALRNGCQNFDEHVID